MNKRTVRFTEEAIRQHDYTDEDAKIWTIDAEREVRRDARGDWYVDTSRGDSSMIESAEAAELIGQ
jgi:hypothetical protein